MLKNTLATLKPRNDRFERSAVFTINDPIRLFASVYIPDLEKCMLCAAIMNLFLVACELADIEGG